MGESGGHPHAGFRRRTLAPSVVLLAGFALSALAFAQYVRDSGGDLTGLGGAHRPPFSETVGLAAGIDYYVYEYIGAEGDGRVQAESVRIEGPDGAVVPLRAPDPRAADEFGDSLSDIRRAVVASFTVTTSGDHRIVVEGDGGPTGIAVASSSRSRAAPWWWVVAVGVLLAVIGGTWWLVAAVRWVVLRARAENDVAAGRLRAPAGWYPDPGRPGGQRYWDGQQWTEHQA